MGISYLDIQNTNSLKLAVCFVKFPYFWHIFIRYNSLIFNNIQHLALRQEETLNDP